MTDDPIETPPPDHFLTPEEFEKYNHPETSTHVVFTDGKLLPVGRMFGMEGQIVTNPMHAFGCVAFEGRWKVVSCRPGDISPRREGRPWLATKR